ncbi:MAG TPA: hypothetical protein VIK39_05465, partial [Candidatus Angelobacter sp.]
MKSAKLCVFVAILMTGIVPAIAQTNPNEEQGLKPYDSWHGGDLDSVSMTTGGLALHIPLASFPQRGNLNLSFMVRHSTKQWYVKPAKYDQSGHIITPASWQPMANSGTQVVSSVDWWLQGSWWPDMGGNGGTNWTFGVMSPDGNTHNLGGDTNGATNGPTFPLRSFDATGLLYSNYQTLILPNGTRYTYPVNGLIMTGPPPSTSKLGIQATNIVDANGNQISIGANGWTDTMGRLIPGQGLPVQPGVSTTNLSTCPSGTTSAAIWAVPGIAGVDRIFKFCYSPVTLQTSFGINAQEYGPVSTPLITAIVLPDLTTMWTFAYDSYGDITRLGFPTGGSIVYTYTTAPGQCNMDTQISKSVASRTVDASDGTGGHTWSYTYVGQITATPIGNGQLQDNYSGTTKITSPAPDLNDTVHTIVNPLAGAFCNLYDTQVQYYQGSASAGILLKTVNTQYSGNVDWSRSSGVVADNIVPSQVTTTVGGKTTRIVNTSDTGNTVTQNYLLQAPAAIPVVFGGLMQKDEYDFSNSLVRSTVHHYLWQDNATYKTNNFISLPASSTAKDGAGSQIAQTTYTYDQGTPASSGIGTPTHVAPPAGATIRGNLTAISHWLNTTNTLIPSTATYFDTGMKATSADPLTRTTSYSYLPAFFGAYLTQTNLA